MNREPILGVMTLSAAIAVLFLLNGASRESTQSMGGTSQSGDSTVPAGAKADRRNEALVRLIVAIPDCPPVDVFADDRIAFSDMNYKTVTEYRELPDGRSTFRVRSTDQADSNQLAEQSRELSSGNHYTLTAFESPEGKMELAAFSDNAEPPSSGKAKIRLIHAAPEIGEVDLYVVGRDLLLTGIDSGSQSSYSEIDPIEVTLQVRPAGQHDALLTVPKVRFEAGMVYTMVIIGRAQRSSPLEAFLIEEQFLGSPSAVVRH